MNSNIFDFPYHLESEDSEEELKIEDEFVEEDEMLNDDSEKLSVRPK